MMRYEGYTGRVELDEDARILHGEVVDTRDVITFQGRSVEELEKAFRDSVEDYLDFCASRKESPDKPFSGRMMLRIPPDLHRALYLEAQLERKSLNQLITDRLEQLRQQCR